MGKVFSIFYNNQKGQRVEVSSSEFPYQCMDLAYEWIFINDILKAAIAHKFARDVYRQPNDLTRKYFDIIPNTPDWIPQTGDLVVFDIGEVGHISIATGEGDLKSFKSFDQNWGGGINKYPRVVTHDYDKDKVLGGLRLKDEFKRS